mmetsp:Transcript_28455/g.51425  ORF Transcript_28455/g.51425 Transcript_28455/m.51425 type:complete len:487 (+) Transcript_28455:54-1514(+)
MAAAKAMARLEDKFPDQPLFSSSSAESRGTALTACSEEEVMELRAQLCLEKQRSREKDAQIQLLEARLRQQERQFQTSLLRNEQSDLQQQLLEELEKRKASQNEVIRNASLVCDLQIQFAEKEKDCAELRLEFEQFRRKVLEGDLPAVVRSIRQGPETRGERSQSSENTDADVVGESVADRIANVERRVSASVERRISASADRCAAASTERRTSANVEIRTSVDDRRASKQFLATSPVQACSPASSPRMLTRQTRESADSSQAMWIQHEPASNAATVSSSAYTRSGTPPLRPARSSCLPGSPVQALSPTLAPLQTRASMDGLQVAATHLGELHNSGSAYPRCGTPPLRVACSPRLANRTPNRMEAKVSCATSPQMTPRLAVREVLCQRPATPVLVRSSAQALEVRSAASSTASAIQGCATPTLVPSTSIASATSPLCSPTDVKSPIPVMGQLNHQSPSASSGSVTSPRKLPGKRIGSSSHMPSFGR